MKRIFLVILVAMGLCATAQVLTIRDGAFIGASRRSGSTSVPYVTNQTLATLRNDFTGRLGFWGVVSNGNLNITDLGRWVISGDDANHTLAVYTNIFGSAVLVGSVTFNCAGATTNQFGYSSVSMTLINGGTYAIVSSEVSGGSEDRWGDGTTTIQHTDRFVCQGRCYSSDGVSFSNATATDNTYGPVNFKYSP